MRKLGADSKPGEDKKNVTKKVINEPMILIMTLVFSDIIEQLVLGEFVTQRSYFHKSFSRSTFSDRTRHVKDGEFCH